MGPRSLSSLALSLDRKGGVYRVQSLESDPARTLASGRLDLPPDLCNGMVLTRLRQLASEGEGTGHVVAFTPEPKVVPLKLMPGSTSTIRIGHLTKRVTQYALAPAGTAHDTSRKIAWQPAAGVLFSRLAVDGRRTGLCRV
jgi:hypothetical protein